tara:strand:+ start:1243 stop:1401 length:159 start_codon:yes stop_codon:yes gene_type:complete
MNESEEKDLLIEVTGDQDRVKELAQQRKLTQKEAEILAEQTRQSEISSKELL